MISKIRFGKKNLQVIEKKTAILLALSCMPLATFHRELPIDSMMGCGSLNFAFLAVMLNNHHNQRRIKMKFMQVWTIPGPNWKEADKRVKDEPIEGIKVLGRWYDGNGSGFTLIETDDQLALAKLNLYWGDIGEIQSVPVINQDQLEKIQAD